MAKIAKVQEVSLEKLVLYEKNAKKHPQEQIDLLERSIKEYGFINPCLIDKDYKVIAGHGRIAAAKQIGMDKVPCLFVEGLTEAQYKAYVLADNRLTELGEWNMDLVMMELQDLQDMDFDISLTGFEMPEEEDDVEIVEDDIPDEGETRCKIGDVWQLGDHRLICGDCTDVNVIETLMGGAYADMVFTDPPYNVAMSRTKVDGSNNSIMNDNLDSSSYEQLLRDAFNNAVLFCKTCVMYWWIGFREYSRLEQIFKDNNVDIANCIVWDKGSIGLGGKGYRYQHELCIFSGETNNNSASDVWQFSRSTEGIHPTMKPVSLIAHAINNISNIETVLDIFGGSGSTLIACEQTGRRCYMCELDEHYCDVIIERWETFSGREAVLLNG